MLTNCHTLILRELLGHGARPPDAELAAYVYNVAPDALPLSREFRAGDTHRFAPPSGALDRHPALIWVKCHIVVDNLCHYGTVAKPAASLAPAEKEGYTYRKGAELVPLAGEFAREMGVSLDPPTAHYLAHVLVEIAVDYAIYLDDPSVPRLLREAQIALRGEAERAYAEGLAELYGCPPERVARARGAPQRFYGDLDDFAHHFLEGRTKIILRKMRLDYSEENVGRARRLIEEAAQSTGDYKGFVREAVAALADAGAWRGEAPLASEAE